MGGDERGADRDGTAIELVLALGEALHRYGAPAHRLEEALSLVAQKLGLHARFFSTPTSIFAAFGPLSAERTCLVRVEPGELDLEKLSLLHEVTAALVDGRLDVDEARRRVDAVVARAPRYGALATTFCFGSASLASALFLSGSLHDVVAAFAVGLGVGGLGVLCQATRALSRIAEPLAAAFASAAAAVIAHFVAGATPYVLTLAGVIALLPGLTLTTALRELSTKHLASGTARLMGAVVSLLGTGFGVAIGSRVADLLPPREVVAHAPWPLPVLGVAVVIASLSFLVLMRAPPKDAGWIVAGGALAYAGARVGAGVFGPELGAFAGAFVIAAAANVWARVLDRPATVPLVPALLLLVPGSVGFKSVFSMLEREVLSAVDAAFTMALVTTSLVAGVLVAHAAFPPRRPL